MNPVLNWFLVGLGLILLEFVVPGIVLVFFGIAAWIVCLLAWLGVVENTTAQLVIFLVSSIVLLFGCRRYVKTWFVGTALDTPGSLEEFVGKQVKVVADIPGGPDTGKVELKGAEWRARSDTPLTSGSIATVTRRDGLVLVVNPV